MLAAGDVNGTSVVVPSARHEGRIAAARERYDCEVAVVRYDNLMRPVVDARPEGFCKLIVERHRRHVFGADVVGEYSAEVIQMVAEVYGRQHADRAERRAAVGPSEVH